MQWLDIASRTVGITSYAARRAALRGISKAEVESVLANPTSLAPSRDAPDRLVCKRTVRGRRLVVVIEGVPNDSWWVVVTTWEERHDG